LRSTTACQRRSLFELFRSADIAETTSLSSMALVVIVVKPRKHSLRRMRRMGYPNLAGKVKKVVRRA
jgi:hypothetical protein